MTLVLACCAASALGRGASKVCGSTLVALGAAAPPTEAGGDAIPRQRRRINHSGVAGCQRSWRRGAGSVQGAAVPTTYGHALLLAATPASLMLPLPLLLQRLLRRLLMRPARLALPRLQRSIVLRQPESCNV